MEQKTIAKEGGHWYKRDGSPCYEIPAKSGELRSVTLRDARKLNLVPSVTTVMNIAAKPGLERWKMMQVLMAALTLPQAEGETLDAYADRVIVDAAEHAKNAAGLGTTIHGVIEKFFCGELSVEGAGEWGCYLFGVIEALDDHFGPDATWSAEKSFSCDLGYGGKVDLHSPSVVVDFKTKPFDAEAIPAKLAYPEMAMQLAAYRYGLGIPEARMVNVFISTSVPGLVKVHEWEDSSVHFRKFCLLLDYWRLERGYHP